MLSISFLIPYLVLLLLDRERKEMEPNGLLEELMAPRRENWTSFPTDQVNDQFFPSGWNPAGSFNESLDLGSSNLSFLELITSPPSYAAYAFNENHPFLDHGYMATEIGSSNDKNNGTTVFSVQEECPSRLDERDVDVLGNDLHCFEEISRRSCTCEDETEQLAIIPENLHVFSVGSSGERKNKAKKVEGQPSKNLMAERRRRKRLNDRLSMLRSIVPKISKMDRTSILGDTIDYMKELMAKIHKLQEEDLEEPDVDRINLVRNLKELSMKNEGIGIVKNTNKFGVERRDKHTHIEIGCATKPGLLLSTVNTIEASGLDIHQCIVSCFNDFSLQASCAEAVEHRRIISCEDLKQALFRNAGYGGRCF